VILTPVSPAFFLFGNERRLRAVCESPRDRFWLWLPKVLVTSIWKVPRVIVAMCVQIREPIWEIIIGGVATVLFPVMIIDNITGPGPYLNLTERVIVALLTIPSFLVMMHGIYREDDC